MRWYADPIPAMSSMAKTVLLKNSSEFGIWLCASHCVNDPLDARKTIAECVATCEGT